MVEQLHVFSCCDFIEEQQDGGVALNILRIDLRNTSREVCF